MSLKANSVLRRAADVRFRAVADETVVIRQEAAEALVLNEVAGRLLELIDGQRSVADLLEQLQTEYDVTPEQLEVDVQSYLEELVDTGVLSRD